MAAASSSTAPAASQSVPGGYVPAPMPGAYAPMGYVPASMPMTRSPSQSMPPQQMMGQPPPQYVAYPYVRCATRPRRVSVGRGEARRGEARFLRR